MMLTFMSGFATQKHAAWNGIWVVHYPGTDIATLYLPFLPHFYT
jgi:hypothetical protein